MSRAFLPTPQVGSQQVASNLEGGDVLKLEGVGNFGQLLQAMVHHVDKGLEDGHAFLRQPACVVDGHPMQLIVLLPVLIWRGKETAKSARR
jgi:hypothetical protein